MTFFWLLVLLGLQDAGAAYQKGLVDMGHTYKWVAIDNYKYEVVLSTAGIFVYKRRRPIKKFNDFRDYIEMQIKALDDLQIAMEKQL